MAKYQFLNWGKSLKLPKLQFHEKNENIQKKIREIDLRI